MNETFDAVIVAAGSGKRLGYDIPKAFVPLCGKPMLEYSVETFLAHSLLSRLVVVVPGELIAPTQKLFAKKPIIVVAGGSERWESVRNGCKLARSEWILVHDAARPFVSEKVITALLKKRTQFQCVISATPVVDTIRHFKGDIAGETIDRAHLVRVGTPQLFRTTLLSTAFQGSISKTSPPTDEAVLIQNMEISVGIAEGDPINFKITTREDFKIAEALIKNGIDL